MSPKLQPALYVVATPIGNLEDITLRALRALREAEVIACEDTRHTQKLLNHFEIKSRTVSYHQHNEQAAAEHLIARIEGGESVALVSDAGTPGISDPGSRVIALAIERGIKVEVVPGASAVITALVASGMNTEAFRYIGFLPAKAGQRRSALESLRAAQETVVCYEAPHRILETLADIAELLGPSRPLALARELTKVHEEVLRGPAAELLRRLQTRPEGAKGEMVLLIGAVAPGESSSAEKQKPTLAARLAQIMREQQLDEKSALKALAKEIGMGKSELYRELQRQKAK